ncbi:MAG: TetR/AcrR family transcriptional regulator C-terminal domain-containing protein [Clostridia bacterium]|nr:TetR/AcrR family transcriptional regulator C-terminal domain-containing protein [Clostridia bacterium]
MADSVITKKALAASLKKLMEKEPFLKISVGDICEKCNMSRKSFYYHFSDKYELVNWIFDTEFKEFVCVSEINGIYGLKTLTYYFYENRNFYRKAFAIECQNSFSEHFRSICYPAIFEEIKELAGFPDAMEFQANLLTDGVICSFKRWLTLREPMLPDEFLEQINICLRIVAKQADIGLIYKENI